MYLVWQLFFIFLHLFSYMIFFRRLTLFKQEKTILLFHLFPYALLTLGMIIGWCEKMFGVPTVISSLALQLIYSMSFLEIWSLSQGSYSIQILLRIASSSSCSEQELIEAAQSIGTEKKKSRLNGLLAMGLIQKSRNSYFQLTESGYVIVKFFSFIKFLANIKKIG